MSLKRLWWALLPSVLFLLLARPEEIRAYEVDPYLYRTLKATMTFTYDRSDTKSKAGEKRVSTYFEQRYALDATAYILSNRLLVYDAGIAFVNNDAAYDGSQSNSNNLNYYLKTILLRKSSIPLMLFGNKTTSRSTAGGSARESEATTTSYGFNWQLKFRRLPTTGIYADRNTITTERTENMSTNYGLDMTKDIGSSHNTLDYKIRQAENKRTGSERSRSALNFRNRTKISKATMVSAGFTRGVSEASGSEDTETQGLSLSLTSSPSSEFSQSHSYTSFMSRGAGNRSDGKSYNGDMDYKFSSKLSTGVGLGITSNENEGKTTATKDDSLNTSARAKYRVTNNLSVSENLSYYRFKSSASADPKEGSLGERTLFRATTNINYSKTLKWAQLSTQYGLGYVDDKTSEENKGKGLEHSVSANLSEIDFNRYANFNTGGSYSYTENLSGTLGGRYYSLIGGVYNKVLRRYFDASASYERDKESSWISVLESKKQRYGMRVSSNYFKKTKLSLETEHLSSFQEKSDYSDINTTTFTGSHVTTLYDGALTGTVSFSVSDTSYPGRSEQRRTTIYSASYSRRLSRTLSWNARLLRDESKIGGNLTKNTMLQNMIDYALRAWFITAEHRYRLFETSFDRTTENSIHLMATRSFVRFF